jgi:hypothetical protein
MIDPLNLNPPVTLAELEKAITHEYYFTAEQGVFGHQAACNTLSHIHPALGSMTFCVLVLQSGVTVTGVWTQPATTFSTNQPMARHFARQNALGQLWQRPQQPPMPMPTQPQWWETTPPTIT